jgi:hypothetical protein
LVPNVKGDENQIYFIYKGERIEQPIYYIEKGIFAFEIVFGINCSQHEIIVNSSVLRPFTYKSINAFNKDESKKHGIAIKSDSLPGKYNVSFNLNYTNDNDQIIEEQYYFNIEFLNAFIIKDIIIPSGEERTISIEMESFVKLKQLEIFIYPSGDIDMKDIYFNYEDVTPGNITVTSEISKLSEKIGEQGFTYIINVKFDSGEEKKYNEYIPTEINWTFEENVKSINWKIKIIFLFIVIITIWNIIFYLMFLRKKKKKHQPPSL